MKTKLSEKKLTLNKQTVSHLSVKKMEEIKGGITNTCWSEDPNETCTTTFGETTLPWFVSAVDKTYCEICIP